MKFRDREKQYQNIMSYIPVRNNVEWVLHDESSYIILKKNFTRFEKFLQKYLKGPEYMRYKLDKIGTSIWQLCDGTYTIKDICSAMEEKYKEEIEPASQRVIGFINMLLQRNLIFIRKEKMTKNNSTT